MAPRVRLADTASIGIRVARTMYGRWRRLGASDRGQMEALADDVKRRALRLRGESDRVGAGRDLNAASERLAAAMVESADADPEITDVQVAELRDDLARELARLASADIKASRGPRDAAPGAAGTGSAGQADVNEPL